MPPRKRELIVEQTLLDFVQLVGHEGQAFGNFVQISQVAVDQGEKSVVALYFLVAEMLKRGFLFRDALEDTFGGVGNRLDHLVELVPELVVLLGSIFGVDEIERLNDIPNISFFVLFNFIDFNYILLNII